MKEKKIYLKKPCRKLGYCPYGALVEQFKLRMINHKVFSCKIFGHDCPVFSCAEGFIDGEKVK
jgi:hypothetical protein